MPTSPINCGDLSYDNRETCVNLVPSSCVPYTGYISDTIKDSLPCRPNVNDVLKKLQELIDTIQGNVGDPSTLNSCLDLPDGVTYAQLIQIIFNEICAIKTVLTDLPTAPDPDTITFAIDILCLLDPSCTPQTSYTLTEIILKLITAYCSLSARVKTLEDTLNL